MNNSTETKGFWIPYKIPPTPNISNDDVYALTCSNGADSTKNPSQFLSWKLLPSSGGGGFPEGAIALKVTLCVNGIPKEYWMAAWDEEPEFE